MRVLFVGDKSGLSKKIETALSEAAVEVTVLDYGQVSDQTIQTGDHHLIILGSSGPNSFRIGLVDNLRRNRVHTPILVLSAGLHWHDKVSALETGADACLELPCPPELLVAYAKAIIRRDQLVSARKVIQIEHLYIDTRSCSVRVKDALIQLTADEYKLLLLLAEHEGVAVSKRTISQRLHHHDDYFGESNIPEVLICRIRKKLEGVIPHKYIKTVRGAGYMLCASENNAGSLT